MLKVSTVNLSPDATRVGSDHSSEEPFELDVVAFTALLESFRSLDAVAIHEADPHLLVSARAGKFVVRTGRRKLYLYDARDPAAPYAEFEPDELIARIDAAPTTPAAPPETAPAQPAIPEPAPHRGIAITMLALGLALNGYTLYSFFYIDSVDRKPAVTLITDATELAREQRNVVGTYATGAQPGDRVITVNADGSIRFYEIGGKKNLSENTDTYRLGRHDNRLCLTTVESGIVDVLNQEAVVYYRDTYRRTK